MNESNQLELCLNRSECRVISISLQVPLSWALPLYGYLMPVIVAITFATNSFIVLILSQKFLRSSTNYVLLAMAVSELLTGLTCLPWLLYYYTLRGFETDQKSGLSSFWCTMFPFMAFILPSIFHTAAIWLTVYLAVQRYIYICLPKYIKTYCSLKRSKEVILEICLAAVIFYAPDIFAMYNKSFSSFNKVTNENIRLCVRVQTSFIDMIGIDTYHFVIYGLHTAFIHTLPCILLVTFTWKLIRAIEIADKRHAMLLSRCAERKYSELNIGIPIDEKRSSILSLGDKIGIQNLKSNLTDLNRTNKDEEKNLRNAKKSITRFTESRRVQALKQNTRMLIVVIILFLIIEIPAALIFATHVGTVTFRINAILKYYGVMNKLLIIRNVLIIISYPFRFAIYCGMSQQFREAVRKSLPNKVCSKFKNNPIFEAIYLIIQNFSNKFVSHA